MDNPGIVVQFPAEARGFSLRQKVQNGFGANSSSYSKDTTDSFPKHTVKMATHLSSDKVKNERSYTSASQYAMELNITEIFACYKIRLAELIHNTAQAPLWPKYLMMIKK